MLFLLHEHQIAGLSLSKAGDARDFNLAVADRDEWR